MIYIFAAIIVMFVIVAVSGFFVIGELTRAGRLVNRIEFVVGGGNKAPETKPEGSALLRFVSSLGVLIARSGLLSRKTLAEMTATLEGAGFRGGRGLGLFIGAKILLALLVPMVLLFVLHNFGTGTFWTMVKLAGGAVIGLLLPETLANNIRQRHLTQVAAGVPDALDMLVICADAGLALEAGLARVSQEIGNLNPALAMELTQTSRELQIGSDMRKAMEALGQRTGLDTLKRLNHALAIAAIRHATNPGAAHALRRIAPGSPGAVRGARRSTADHDDHSNDPFHPAMRVSHRSRAGHR